MHELFLNLTSLFVIYFFETLVVLIPLSLVALFVRWVKKL